MSIEYNDYLSSHISNVQKAIQWLDDNLDLTSLGFEEYDISSAIDHTLFHDDSKTTTEEYRPYDEYFYGGNKSYQVVLDFNYAWLHHIHNNPHHWQYWLLVQDDPEPDPFEIGPFKKLEMPKCYLLEMIADWWSFSWKNGDLRTIFDWYEKHYDRIYLHPKTRLLVDRVLDAIRTKLDEISLTHGAMLTEEELEDRHYALPEKRKYPLPNIRHVKSAIRFFNYVEPKDEERLAKAILDRAEELGMDINELSVGDENRFKKYIPNEKLEYSDMEEYRISF